jgi:hypothetical protein
MTDEASDREGQIDPDGSSYEVMAIYGTLMLQVQALELSVAALSLIADLGRSSGASIRRQIDAAHKRSRHAFHRDSLSASRDRLRGKIDDELFAEIEGLLPHRNRLAHRFLVERMIEAYGSTRFKPGTALEILEYARRFKSTGKKVQGEIRRQTQDLPDAPDEVASVLDRFARSVVFAGDVSASELRDPASLSTAPPGPAPLSRQAHAEPS